MSAGHGVGPAETPVCRRCGADLTRLRVGALYCSGACRQAAYRARRPAAERRWEWRECLTCGEPLTGSPRKTFCNDTCRKRAGIRACAITFDAIRLRESMPLTTYRWGEPAWRRWLITGYEIKIGDE